MEAKERGGEKSMNGAADIIFLPCIIRNRGCRCRRVKISYVPGILVYIYRMNIEIFPSRRPLFVVVVARRYRAETLIFQRSIEQRREKSIDRASPLPFPSPSPPIYLERVISRSRFSTMLHIRATPYRAFVTFYFDNNSSIDESN